MKVIAQKAILYAGRNYSPGDVMPTSDNKMVELWKKYGSVKVEGSFAPECKASHCDADAKPKATLKCAEPGLACTATPPSGDAGGDLVGKIPKIGRESRKKA